ncbi:MAG: dihydrofolate reductase family protein, partial [Eubacterium sp.]|nr:dihydrofolate reductase family protein [Eubacterium sp.]
KNIWICGGANIANQCIQKDIIDEYRITTIPVILGGGIRLFNENNPMIKLRLKKVKKENGLIECIYVKR